MTGQSTTTYRGSRGNAQYQKKALEVLETILKSHSARCVIVCGVLTLTRGAQHILSRYAETHPIVHIIRDAESVQRYLQIQDDKVVDMMQTTETLFRTCSNLEFYNASTNVHGSELQANTGQDSGLEMNASRLLLKKAERCFLHFLARGTNIQDSPALDRVFPLSQIAPHARPYTCAMRLPAHELANSRIDVETFDEGADAFELYVKHSTVSFTNISKAVSKLRRSTIIPIIYHVSTPFSGLAGQLKRAEYLDLVSHGIRLASAYATLDLSLSDEELLGLLRSKGRTRLIALLEETDATKHDWLHPHWLEAYQRAQKLGFDLVRFCWPAKHIEDNFQAQVLRSRVAALPGASIPLIAYNTGLIGRTSACWNPVLQPVTHHDWRDKSENDAPQTTAIDITKSLFSSFVFEPLNFYILGASSAYSLSPVMHNAAYRACGMSHSYSTFQTSHLNELRTLINDPQFGGCSISLPFKLEVMNLMHSISSHAKAIGAINTVVALREVDGEVVTPDNVSYWRARNRAGPVKQLYGENTDWIGIRACVRRGLSPANAVSPKTTVLIIGAGGMSRAAIYGMLQLGVRNIVIFNRTRANTEKLIAHYQGLLDDKLNGRPSSLTIPTSTDMPVRFAILDSTDEQWLSGFSQPTIIISCIPTHRIGDVPSPEFTLPEHWLQSPTGGVVMEVAYRNIRTPLLEQIRSIAAHGWVTMDGLDLLPDQAFAQFELFTGKRAPRRLMRGEVLKGYRDEEGRPDPELIERRLAQIHDQDP
jgi:shikimate 5-dehydrogenase